MSDGLPTAILQKRERLIERIKAYGSVLVAVSGGVDSGVLLKAATLALGPERAQGVCLAGDIFPAREHTVAEQMAAEHGLTLRVLNLSPIDEETFKNNPVDRCYHCKTYLFTQLVDTARAEGFAAVLEGTNLDDLGDHRPGMRAVQELGVQSPLRDAELHKSEIRAIARDWGLGNWDEPSAACLASRVPFDNPIDRESLARIDKGEEYLIHTWGLRCVRVRYDGMTARIETTVEDLPRLVESEAREAILAEFERLGFRFVALDLKGYRTGSLNP